MKSVYGESKQSKQAGVTAGSVNRGRPISYLLENSNSQLGGSEAGRSAYKRAGRQIEIDTLYDTTMAKLLVIGHSFVRRLKEYLGGKGLRLERQFSSTVIRGFGGMRLASLRQHLVIF